MITGFTHGQKATDREVQNELARERLLEQLRTTRARPRVAGWTLGLTPQHTVYLSHQLINDGLLEARECSDTAVLTEKGKRA